MPPSVARDTGLDVLTHAIESYVCSEACEFTRTYSLKAIQLVCKYLRPAIKQKDPLAQEKVLYASTMSGVAFGQSGLGINHSLAHALGGKFGCTSRSCQWATSSLYNAIPSFTKGTYI